MQAQRVLHFSASFSFIFAATSHTVYIVGAVLGFAMLASLVLAVIGWICFIVKRRQNRIGENQPLLQDQGQQGQPRRLNQLRNDDPGE